MKKLGCVCVALFLATTPVEAGNGHYLHGIGAVNSSLGGVAAAMPFDIVGALHVNPAVLTEFEGDQFVFGVELFTDQPKATSSFEAGNPLGQPAGSSFTTEADTELGVLPAIALSHRFKNKPYTVATGFLAIAGFRTDWPQDPGNPIFRPQPNGFGAVKTNLAIAKVPLAVAYRANDQLSLGFALNFYLGTLAISPLPPATPDCTNPTAGSPRVVDCFFADADNTVSAYAVGLQAGFLYKVSPKFAIGGSYSTAPDFNDYEWNSQNALPYLQDPPVTNVVGEDQNRRPNPEFGFGKKVRYPLDGQAIVSVGVGFTPNDRLRIGIDGRWYGYSSVDGAGGVGGFRTDRGLNEIGWDDILIGAIGVDYCAKPNASDCGLVIRGGFNYSETPIRERSAFTSLGTPPTFQDHYTLGLGFQATEKIQINLGAYYAPERSVTGPLLNPFFEGDLTTGPPSLDVSDDQIVPGTAFTITEQLLSALVAVSYKF